MSCAKAKGTEPITSQGPGKPVTLTASYDWENCTYPTKTLKAGGEETDAPGESTTATVKATSESQETMSTTLFGSCVYGVTAGTTIGSVNESTGEFSESVVTQKLSGSAIACPETAKWIAEWIRTVPDPYIYDNN